MKLSARYFFLLVTASSLAFSACGSSGAKSTTLTTGTTSAPIATTTTTVKPLPASPTAAEVVATTKCGCKVASTVDGLTAPGGASATAAITYTDANPISFAIYVVDSNKKVLYSALDAGDTGMLSDAKTVAFKKDKTGNLLVAFTRGAHSSGIYALRVSASGVDDFGSKPKVEGQSGTFSGDSPGEIKDVDGDGIFEVVSRTNDYTPDYASGTSYTSTFHWNGSTYVIGDCSKNGPKTNGTVNYKPANGACF